ncbi:MAG: substrate-binding domain-containing protein [Magnetospirillum sp.]|nr:substrate-binding domain-containing protein [Magnetospirillum sp.]
MIHLSRRAALARTCAALVAPILLLPACGDATQSADAAGSGGDTRNDRPRIALVMKTLDNPFFAEMARGAATAERDTGVNLSIAAARSETSIDQQIAIVGNFIDEKVAAIVIAPSDSVKLVPALVAAKAAGIKVVNLDNRLDPEFARQSGLGTVPFIGIDNVRAAHAAAHALSADLGTPAEAAIIEGIRNAANNQARKLGAIKGFAENANVRLVASESANWLRDEAASTTRSILAAYPGLKLLFCANDMMALGALDTLARLERTDVVVAGFDNIPEVEPALRSGRLAVTVDQRAAEMGRKGVEAALNLIRGQAVPAETIIETRVVTSRELRR